MKEVKSFYDDYAAYQSDLGLNRRHKSILKWLDEFGIGPSDRILEIGSGVGVISEELAKRNPDGLLLVNDLSPKSIEIAKEKLKKYAHVKYSAKSILNANLKESFDWILLPDVLEHIPLDQHKALFQKLAQILSDNGTIFIHVPNPYYFSWVEKNQKELTQVIDQAIYTSTLVNNSSPFGLYIHFLTNYSIWKEPADYTLICLKKEQTTNEYQTHNPPPPSLFRRIVQKIKGFGKG